MFSGATSVKSGNSGKVGYLDFKASYFACNLPSLAYISYASRGALSWGANSARTILLSLSISISTKSAVSSPINSTV